MFMIVTVESSRHPREEGYIIIVTSGKTIRALASLSQLRLTVTRVGKNISSVFPHFPADFHCFPQIFFIFSPHFGLPGGRMAHPGLEGTGYVTENDV